MKSTTDSGVVFDHFGNAKVAGQDGYGIYIYIYSSRYLFLELQYMGIRLDGFRGEIYYWFGGRFWSLWDAILGWLVLPNPTTKIPWHSMSLCNHWHVRRWIRHTKHCILVVNVTIRGCLWMLLMVIINVRYNELSDWLVSGCLLQWVSRLSS